MKKELSLVVSLVCMIVLFVGCKAEKSVGDESNFNAKILEIYENSVLVEALEGESIRNSSDQFTFGTKELDDIGATVGDIVTITYTGDIRESYPAQITAVSWAIYEPEQ